MLGDNREYLWCIALYMKFDVRLMMDSLLLDIEKIN